MSARNAVLQPVQSSQQAQGHLSLWLLMWGILPFQPIKKASITVMTSALFSGQIRFFKTKETNATIPGHKLATFEVNQTGLFRYFLAQTANTMNFARCLTISGAIKT